MSEEERQFKLLFVVETSFVVQTGRFADWHYPFSGTFTG